MNATPALETTITESPTANPPTEQGPTVPATGSTPPRGRKASKQYLTFPHGRTSSVVINALAIMPMSLGALMADLGRSRNAIWHQLTRLVRAGVVLKLARGYYALGPGSMDAVRKASNLEFKPGRKTAFIVMSAN